MSNPPPRTTPVDTFRLDVEYHEIVLGVRGAAGVGTILLGKGPRSTSAAIRRYAASRAYFDIDVLVEPGGSS